MNFLTICIQVQCSLAILTEVESAKVGEEALAVILIILSMRDMTLDHMVC